MVCGSFPAETAKVAAQGKARASAIGPSMRQSRQRAARIARQRCRLGRRAKPDESSGILRTHGRRHASAVTDRASRPKVAPSAQKGGCMDSSTNGGDEAALLAVIFAALGLILVVSFIANVIMTYFIWSAYKVVPAQFQKLKAGLVWLCVVPCIGSIMLIVCSVMIPQAFQAAFAARGRSEFGNCSFPLALVGSIGMLAGGVVPLIGGLIALGCFVAFIVFIVKLHGYKRALLAG
jgi:hypothetical protein